MKELIRRALTNALSIFLISIAVAGLHVNGGFISYIVAGLLLAVFNIILDPIVKIFTLPFNILTLGLLSFLTTLASLFLLTVVYPNVTVSNFTFQGVSLLGLTIGQIQFGGILSYVVISATIYFLNKIINSVFSN